VRYLIGIAVAIAVGSAGCERDPLRPATARPEGTIWFAYAPAWSHDGSMIAFAILVDSGIGQYGIYVVPAGGGQPRYVGGHELYRPYTITFAPNDKALLVADGASFAIIDLVSGAVVRPLFTSTVVTEADWSPDGNTIIYNRRLFDRCCPESGGVHLFDLRSGTDRAWLDRDGVIYGNSAKWSPRGDCVALIEQRVGYSGVAIWTLDGRKTELRREEWPDTRWQYLRWRANSGRLELEFRDTTDPGGPYRIYDDGTGFARIRDWQSPFPWSAVSWDGQSLVGADVDEDGAVVLFIRKYFDVFGVTRRQLTFYEGGIDEARKQGGRRGAVWPGREMPLSDRRN